MPLWLEIAMSGAAFSDENQLLTEEARVGTARPLYQPDHPTALNGCQLSITVYIP